MLQIKKIIRSDIWDNSVLVTLYGRCGLVDKNLRNVVIEFLV